MVVSKYTYENYIKNGCHPTGYNEACESYYFGQSTVDMLLDKVADLEGKLAESESKVAVGRFWHSAYEGKQLDYDKLNNDYNKQEKLLSRVLADKSKLQFEFDQLKQQLPEKDKELLEIKQRIAEKASKEFQEMIDKRENHNQDKISFAVEQIVKTKETLIKFLQDEGFYENEWYDLFEKIDNQIKQLKEGKWHE